MELKEIGELIAVRRLFVQEQDGSNREVLVKFGKPVPFPGSEDYYCPFQIVGIGSERVRYAGGVDAVQAIQLVMVALGAELFHLNKHCKGRLHWEAGEVSDFGFPPP